MFNLIINFTLRMNLFNVISCKDFEPSIFRLIPKGLIEIEYALKRFHCKKLSKGSSFFFFDFVVSRIGYCTIDLYFAFYLLIFISPVFVVFLIT